MGYKSYKKFLPTNLNTKKFLTTDFFVHFNFWNAFIKTLPLCPIPSKQKKKHHVVRVDPARNRIRNKTTYSSPIPPTWKFHDVKKNHHITQNIFKGYCGTKKIQRINCVRNLISVASIHLTLLRNSTTILPVLLHLYYFQLNLVFIVSLSYRRLS